MKVDALPTEKGFYHGLDRALIATTGRDTSTSSSSRLRSSLLTASFFLFVELLDETTLLRLLSSRRIHLVGQLIVPGFFETRLFFMYVCMWFFLPVFLVFLYSCVALFLIRFFSRLLLLLFYDNYYFLLLVCIFLFVFISFSHSRSTIII